MEQKYVGDLTSQSGFELSESQSYIVMTHSHFELTFLLGRNCFLSLCSNFSLNFFVFSSHWRFCTYRHLQSRLPSSRRQAMFCRCSTSFISILEASICSTKWRRNINPYLVSVGLCYMWSLSHVNAQEEVTQAVTQLQICTDSIQLSFMYVTSKLFCIKMLIFIQQASEHPLKEKPF